MSDYNLISLADLKAMVEGDHDLQVYAHKVTMGTGYYLVVDDRKGVNSPDLILATYLAEQIRIFKRADALINELGKIGLNRVVFELDRLE